MRFGMNQHNKFCNPIVPGCKLTKDENGKPADATSYKKMVWSLRNLLATRPDLAYSVCLVARYMEILTKIHLTATKRILRYLKGTMNLGVLYNMNDEEVLQGWSDFDYPRDNDDRKVPRGMFSNLGHALCHGIQRSIPLWPFQALKLSLLQQLHVFVNQYGFEVFFISLSDSKPRYSHYVWQHSTIKLSKNPVMHGTCKHIDLKFHFLRTWSKMIQFRLSIKGEQLADVLTKLVKLETFNYIITRIRVCVIWVMLTICMNLIFVSCCNLYLLLISDYGSVLKYNWPIVYEIVSYGCDC